MTRIPHHAPTATVPGRRTNPGECSRRSFLQVTGGCAAHLLLATAVGGARVRELFAATRRTRIVQEVPWGRLEEVADGIWAMVSDPLEDATTLCNGGIIRGRAGVVLVEAFGSPEGAAWMARQARRLTGRWPDQVVVTHYHRDHSQGLPGVRGEEGLAPSLHTTAATRVLTMGTARELQDQPLLEALERVSVVPSAEPTSLDLGDRQVILVPREGHTASDLSVEVADPSVIFCGDLVWNRFFPNYVDAIPSLLAPSVQSLRRERETVYVPGHGPVADAGAMELYLELLARVEDAARSAHAGGLDAREAAERFSLPGSLADWFLFSDQYPARALGAWLRELSAG